MASWIDSHCHFGDLPDQDQLPEILGRAKQNGISKFLQGGVGPEDWERQIRMNQKYPEIIPCFGLHPYWVASHSDEDCEEALNLLAKLLLRSAGIGEIGLDLRPQYKMGFANQDSEIRQIDCFEKQIEMAKISGKVMVLHLVRAFDEAIQIFEINGPLCRGRQGGLVHGFNGSRKQAEKYLNLDLYLSVGAPLLRADNEKLRQAVQIIPIDRLLIETDGCYNQPTLLFEVARAVAKIKNKSEEEILTICSENTRRLFSVGNTFLEDHRNRQNVSI